MAPVLGDEGKDFKDYINPDSLTVVTGYVEPELAKAEPGWNCQFERLGYFCADRGHHSRAASVQSHGHPSRHLGQDRKGAEKVAGQACCLSGQVADKGNVAGGRCTAKLHQWLEGFAGPRPTEHPHTLPPGRGPGPARGMHITCIRPSRA